VSAVTAPAPIAHHDGPPPHGRKGNGFTRAGWWRALWWTLIAGALGVALPATVRVLLGWPWYQQAVMTTCVLIMMPLGFMLGIGCFDYWGRYMVGAPLPEGHDDHGAYGWRDYFKVNTDHKVIGIQYLVTTFMFFLAGGLLAEAFRAELARPGLQYFTGTQYNGLISVHAAIMIFLFIIPSFAGIANFVVPLMIGAEDMAFPRLNALSFWMLPTGGVIMLASLIWGGFGSGWTAYAPLSTHDPTDPTTFFNVGVQFAGTSSILTAVNFIVTILTMRAPGMTLSRMPLLVWANLTTSALVVLGTPFVAASQFMVLFDRVMHTDFFQYQHGGNVIMYQHIFWFYSHPAVYIMMLPGFGIISEVIAVMSRKPIFGYRAVAFSTISIGVLGFTVWAHHMFVSGMSPWLRVPMMFTTLLIAVPTGIKIFSWVATLWNGVLNLATPMLFTLGFIFTFVIGGLSGIWLAMIPLDIHVSDTYFVVAHIHYVLFGGSVFTIYAGVYFWFPKMTGRLYNERLGRWHFWLTFVSFNATFFPMHYIGMLGMPRRVSDYQPQFGDWNMFISLMAFVLGASTLVFVYNMIVSWRNGPIAPANPWRSLTVEWQVSSPPPVFNFDGAPRIVGGPYNYGQPGATHVVFGDAPTPAAAGGGH
jgi:cytochrome c oxidase subunit 1